MSTTGALKCWGANGEGQLGLGNDQDRGDDEPLGIYLPTALPEGSHLEAVAVGGSHTCALLGGGGLLCWGGNQKGQLGSGDRKSRPSVAVGVSAMAAVDLGGPRAQAIAAGYAHTCALLDTAQVKCWGSNSFGELGLGDRRDRGGHPGEMGRALPTVYLGAGRSARAIAAGTYHTCAIRDRGDVVCWGSNEYGQLGRGFKGNNLQPDTSERDALVDLGRGRYAQALAAGQAHTCALLDNGRIRCWGFNGAGQLGIGDRRARGDDLDELGDNLPYVDLGAGRLALAIAAGADHTCALVSHPSEIKCWGFNAFGELGLGDRDNRGDDAGEMGEALPAVALGTDLSPAALAAGAHHTCMAAEGTNVIKCWGANGHGQLGLGDVQARGDQRDEMGDQLPAVEVGFAP